MVYINYKQPYGPRTCLFAPETLSNPNEGIKKVEEPNGNLDIYPSGEDAGRSGIHLEVSSDVLDFKHLQKSGTDMESVSSNGSLGKKIPASKQVLRSQDYVSWLSTKSKSQDLEKKQHTRQPYKPVYKRLGGTYRFPEEMLAEVKMYIDC